jgi:hypothetical protein
LRIVGAMTRNASSRRAASAASASSSKYTRNCSDITGETRKREVTPAKSIRVSKDRGRYGTLGGTEDDRAVLADESPELGDEPVHRLVTEEDGVGKLALLFRARLERERRTFEVHRSGRL